MRHSAGEAAFEAGSGVIEAGIYHRLFHPRLGHSGTIDLLSAVPGDVHAPVSTKRDVRPSDVASGDGAARMAVDFECRGKGDALIHRAKSSAPTAKCDRLTAVRPYSPTQGHHPQGAKSAPLFREFRSGTLASAVGMGKRRDQ